MLSFKNENENDRTSFSKYYTPEFEINEFNVLIDGKRFFDTTVKKKEETYENFFEMFEMRKINDYTTGNLLDYDFFSNHYKLTAIDLSKQIQLETPNLKQKISFIGKLEEDNGATMFCIIEKSEETIFSFSQNWSIV